MKAIIQDKYGSPDVLELQEVDRPEIGDDDVLVRVHDAGIHIGDWHLMTGLPYLMRVMGFGFRAPKARVRGTDVAGTVEAVGKNVTRFQAGDEVFGTCDGSFAEYAGAREDTLAPKPASLTFEQAAAVPTSACTALQALRDTGGIEPGQKVLIVGASGGVGMFAVQIAKSFDAEVTGVCSTTKVDLVRSIGADHVIDYTQGDFTRSGQRYDLILDMGGNRSLSRLRRALTPEGTLVLVGSEGGDRWIGAVGRSIRALVVSPFVSQRLCMIFATANTEDLRFLKELIEAGKVTPVIDRTYPLSEVPTPSAICTRDALGGSSSSPFEARITTPLTGDPHASNPPSPQHEIYHENQMQATLQGRDGPHLPLANEYLKAGASDSLQALSAVFMQAQLYVITPNRHTLTKEESHVNFDQSISGKTNPYPVSDSPRSGYGPGRSRGLVR